jgi:hypothetical protein
MENEDFIIDDFAIATKVEEEAKIDEKDGKS